MKRSYHVDAVDPLALAAAFDVPLGDVGARLGVTGDWARRLARDSRYAGRVRRAVLQLALERERLAEILG